MAYSVAPTSGSAPYVFTLELDQRWTILAGLYSLEYRSLRQTGSCPVDFSQLTNSPATAQILLDTGIYERSSAVVPGDCFGTQVILRNVATNEVISSATASVDNV